MIGYAIMHPARLTLAEALEQLRGSGTHRAARKLGGVEGDVTQKVAPPAVLIVDDDQPMINLIGRYLDRWGFTWRAVNRASDAITEMGSGRYGWALVDWLSTEARGPRTLLEAATLVHINVAVWTAAPEIVPEDEHALFPVFAKDDWTAIEKWLRS